MRGKRTPQPIEDYIVEVSRASPSLTHSQIAEQIENQFGKDAQVDKSTVGRIRARNGLSGRWGTEDPPEAAIRHWPELNETALRLRAQLAAGAPLPQLLGFPWRSSQDYNGALTLWGGKDDSASLATEESPLFAALNQHLPSHAAWNRLIAWKAAVKELAQALDSAMEEAQRAPEPGSERLVIREQVEEGAVGPTRYYTASGVLEATERKLRKTGHLHEYEIRAPVSTKKWTLVWTRDSSSYAVLGLSEDREEAEGLETRHRELSEWLLSRPCMAEVADAYRGLGQVTRQLEAYLETISHAVRFPGICSLYMGST